MSVALTYRTILTALETLTAGVPDVVAAAAQITHDQFNASYTLNSGTTIPITQVSSQALALIAGSATIDLTNLPGTNGAVINGTGLQVRAIKLSNAVGNAAMTIAQGAANPYLLWGSGFQLILPAPTVNPSEIVSFFDSAAPVIGSGAKTLLITGTGTQVLNVQILLG